MQDQVEKINNLYQSIYKSVYIKLIVLIAVALLTIIASLIVGNILYKELSIVIHEKLSSVNRTLDNINKIEELVYSNTMQPREDIRIIEDQMQQDIYVGYVSSLIKHASLTNNMKIVDSDIVIPIQQPNISPSSTLSVFSGSISMSFIAIDDHDILQFIEFIEANMPSYTVLSSISIKGQSSSGSNILNGMKYPIHSFIVDIKMLIYNLVIKNVPTQ